jgi:hypothetical protein
MSHEDPARHPTDPVSSVSSPPPKRKPPVRVSGYSVERGHRICEIIATTPQSLARLCRLPGMPSVATLMRWLRDHEEFQEAYAIAKQFQVDLLVEEMIEIADDSSADLIVTKDGKTVCNPSAVQRSKLRVEARMWLASKLSPGKYGNPRSERAKPLAPPPAAEAEPRSQVALPEALRMELIEHRRKMMEEREKNREYNSHLVNPMITRKDHCSPHYSGGGELATWDHEVRARQGVRGCDR